MIFSPIPAEEDDILVTRHYYCEACAREGRMVHAVGCALDDDCPQNHLCEFHLYVLVLWMGSKK